MSHPVMLRLCLATALLAAGLLPAQTQLVCGGLNHLTTTSNPYTLQAGLRVGVLFVPATSMQVTRAQFYFPSTNGGGGVITINAAQGTFEIRANDVVTGLPSSTVLGTATTGAGGIISLTGGWQGPAFASPVILSAGQAYWITYTRAPFTGTATIGVQNTPTGPDLTPASFESAGTWSPISTTDQFKVRVTDPSCVPPGPVAAWTTVGAGCAGTGTQIPTLSPFGLPQLGSAANGLSVAGAPAGTPWALFWSFSADPIGFSLGGGCTVHLDAGGLLALAALGLNPLVQGALDSTGSSTISLPVPNDPALSGAGFAFQAALVVPYGVPVGTGTNIVVTECEVATIGL